MINHFESGIMSVGIGVDIYYTGGINSLGWKAKTPLREGINKANEWYVKGRMLNDESGTR